MEASRENARYLERNILDALVVNANLEEVVAASQDILVVVPSHTLRPSLAQAIA